MWLDVGEEIVELSVMKTNFFVPLMAFLIRLKTIANRNWNIQFNSQSINDGLGEQKKLIVL